MSVFVPRQIGIDALTPISDIGSALFMKNPASGKYEMLANVLGLPATGAAPTMLDVTVTTSEQERQIPGRRAASSYEVTMHLTVGNIIRLKKVVNTTQQFLQINSNGSGFDFTGIISAWQNEVSLGAVVEIGTSIAIQSSNDFLEEEVLSLTVPPCYFTSAIPSSPVPTVKIGEDFELNVSTSPANAEVTATSKAASIATATYATGKLTVTGVAAGVTTIILSAEKSSDYSEWLEAFNIVVTA